MQATEHRPVTIPFPKRPRTAPVIPAELKHERTKRSIRLVLEYVTQLHPDRIVADESNRGARNTPISPENFLASFSLNENQQIGSVNLIVKLWMQEIKRLPEYQKPHVLKEYLVFAFDKQHLFIDYDNEGVGDSQPITKRKSELIGIDDIVDMKEISWKILAIRFRVFPILPI